jgi:hypothetical protein
VAQEWQRAAGDVSLEAFGAEVAIAATVRCYDKVVSGSILVAIADRYLRQQRVSPRLPSAPRG